MNALAFFVDLTLKVTVVLLAAHALQATLGCRGSAALRHFGWVLTLGACLLMPALAAVAPAWRLPLLPALPAPDAAPTTTALAQPRQPAAVTTSAAVATAHPRPASPAASVASPTEPPALAAAPSPAPGVWLGLAWLAGGVLVLTPFALAAWRVSRLASAAEAAAPDWAPLAGQVAAGFGLNGIRFVEGPAGAMPMTWGVWRHAILLPTEASGWPEDRLRNVLTHELAHVRRRDCITQALAELACAVYWFHPLVWSAARHQHGLRERACDDLVLRLGASGPDYADHLLQTARGLQEARHRELSAVAMARSSELEGRLLAILDPRRDRREPSRAWALGTAALAAALLLPLAGLSPWIGPTSALAAGGDEEAVAGHEETGHPAPVAERDAESEAEATTAAEDEDEDGAQAANSASPADPRIDQALGAALEDEDIEVRRQAAFALGQRRSEQSAGLLIGALTDADEGVREQAAFALGELRSEKAVAALARALASDEAEDVRRQAAFALGQIRSPEAVPGLMTALADASASVRKQAVFALGELRDERAVPALAKALADVDGEVRGQAAFALGELRSETAVETLARALGADSEAEVRKQAAFALGQIRAAAAVDALIRALADAHPEVRAQAAFALGEIREPRAAEALAKALKDADAAVRKQAAFALGQLM